jgi:hypothetical protein
MTMSPLARARVLGSIVVVVAFVAGVFTGMAIKPRGTQGVNVMVTATNEIPRELDQLDLTDSQEVVIRQILTRGRDRVLGVVRDFDPRMRAAMDTTNREIDAVLTDVQRAALAAYRKDHPSFRDERIIKGPKVSP